MFFPPSFGDFPPFMDGWRYIAFAHTTYATGWLCYMPSSPPTFIHSSSPPLLSILNVCLLCLLSDVYRMSPKTCCLKQLPTMCIILHEQQHYLPTLEQFWLIQLRDFCIFVFVSALLGWKKVMSRISVHRSELILIKIWWQLYCFFSHYRFEIEISPVSPS